MAAVLGPHCRWDIRPPSLFASNGKTENGAQGSDPDCDKACQRRSRTVAELDLATVANAICPTVVIYLERQA